MTPAEQQRHKEIEQRCENGESFRSIQGDYPVSFGTLARVRDGHIVEKPELRHALRLPLYISVVACRCGAVHSYRPRGCQQSFADRIPSDEPQREGILGLYEFMRGVAKCAH